MMTIITVITLLSLLPFFFLLLLLSYSSLLILSVLFVLLSQLSCTDLLSPAKSITDYAVSRGIKSSLRALITCLWLRTTDNEVAGIPLSYAVSTQKNELLLYDYRNLTLYVKGESNFKWVKDSSCRTWTNAKRPPISKEHRFVSSLFNTDTSEIRIWRHSRWSAFVAMDV